MKKLNHINQIITLGLLGFTLATLSACDTGIDRGSSSGSSSSIPSNVSNDDAPADPSYVKLKEIETQSNHPSIISVLFEASDKDNRPLSSLSISDFSIFEDNQPLPSFESASFLASREVLPLTFDTVIMLDISTSISSNDLAKMKLAVKELVIDSQTGKSRLYPGQRLAVYSFNDEVHLVKNFSSSPEHIITALNSISLPISITPTDLYGALINATSLWENKKNINEIHDGIVILITDGADTAGRYTLSSTKNQTDDKKIITIGVGSETNQSVLNSLSTTNTYNVADFNELKEVLGTVRQSIDQFTSNYYLLKYASPKRMAEGRKSNSDHSFHIEVADNQNKQSSSKIKGNFNSYEFSNVVPEVRIGGLDQLELGQTSVYLAKTYWPVHSPSYSFSVSGDCTLNSVDSDKVSITATNTGLCKVSATDNANDSALNYLQISISP